MTEAELIEAAMNAGDATLGNVTAYLSVVSAYLIVAYIVGAELSRFQVIVINVLFVVFAFSFVLAIQTGLANHYLFATDILEYRPEYAVFSSPQVNKLLFAIDSGGVMAALYFMWNIRHPKKK